LSSLPDVVVVVLDCATHSDFPVQSSAWANNNLFRTAFLPEATRFERAIAPSPWTIPSHASLLTGLDPWEHGAHAKGTIPLKTSIPVLPERLEALGYRTALFAGNPVLDGRSGLARGFDVSRVAVWWEHFLRGLSPSHPARVREEPSILRHRSRSNAVDGGMLSRILGEVACQFPFSIDIANHLGQRLGNVSPENARPSPWVEREFTEFVGSGTRAAPIFALLNLCDAHEPYLTDGGSFQDLSKWWHVMSVPQQVTWSLMGNWLPSRQDLQILHQLYYHVLEKLELRLSRLILHLMDTDRWDNTLFIVTSDHGQDFTGDSTLFHRFSMDDSVLRIPLMVKLPSGAPPTVSAERWLSLTDVYYLIMDCVESERRPPELPRRERRLANGSAAPAFSVADGLLSRDLATRWLKPSVVTDLDRVVVAAYTEDTKLVFVPETGSVEAYDAQRPGEPRVHKPLEQVSGVDEINRMACAIAAAVTRSDAEPRPERAGSVDARLASWGYH
jgi:hypothetical protein